MHVNAWKAGVYVSNTVWSRLRFIAKPSRGNMQKDLIKIKSLISKDTNEKKKSAVVLEGFPGIVKFWTHASVITQIPLSRGSDELHNLYSLLA